MSRRAIFTGRNEVLAKVMFLHVSVILLTGGVSAWRGGLPGGGVSAWKGGSFWGVLQIFGGVLQIFGGGVLGGVPPNFRGGGVSPNNGGGGFSPGIRSTFGRYASYWNAFLYNNRFRLLILDLK